MELGGSLFVPVGGELGIELGFVKTLGLGLREGLLLELGAMLVVGTDVGGVKTAGNASPL